MNSNSNKIVKLKYQTIDHHIKLWCKLLDKYYPISEKELELVSYLIQKQLDYTNRRLEENDINELMLSTKMRKEMSTYFKLDPKTLNTYISLLRGKKVIISNLINNDLIPKDELTFKFTQIG